MRRMFYAEFSFEGFKKKKKLSHMTNKNLTDEI